MSDPTPRPHSNAVLEHLREPRNVGRFPAGTEGIRSGEAGDPAAGVLTRLHLQVAADRVVAARFQAFGCSATIAAASYTTELVTGRPVSEVRALTAEEVARGLELPASKRHAADNAAAAARAALRPSTGDDQL